MRPMQNQHNISVEMSGRRRLCGRWDDNIKMDLAEIGCEGVNWIQLMQGMIQLWAVPNVVMIFRLHENGNFLNN
jgi:hypothetical protein